MAGFGDPRVLELLADVWRRPSFAAYQRFGKRVHTLGLGRLAEHAGRRRARLAVLSSFTIDPIVPYLQAGCLERDILPEIFVPGFNQVAPQVLDPSSRLYAFRPDVTFLQVLPEAVLPGGAGGAGLDPVRLAEAMEGLVTAFRRHAQSDLVVANFAPPARFPYLLDRDPVEDACAESNRRLAELAARVPGVHVLDYERLAGVHGRAAVADERLRHLARMELGSQFLPRLAQTMLAWVVALRGFARKCVVVDLDNTLWGGVVGEDGPDGIQLGPEYPGSAFLEFQGSLLALARRGVLLAVNSKNNEAEALAVLDEHPAMLLRREHFAAVRVNWRDKSENIESIAAELNLGLDALVFIDDSPVERALMRRQRPEVLTPEWPADPVLYRTALEALCDFATVSVTGEDRRRGEMYVAEGRRAALRQRSSNIQEYLFGLEIEVEVERARARDVARVHQLVQKTNQFNLTTRRYSAAEIDGFVRDGRARVYVLRNRDAFGDNGLVGVAVVLEEAGGGPAWRIDSLLVSCRVLGRTIESAFLHSIADRAKRAGARRLIGEFVPTPRNPVVADFYPSAGFRRLERGEAGERWELDLTEYAPPTFPWLKLHGGADLAGEPDGPAVEARTGGP